MTRNALLVIDLQNAVFDGRQIPPVYRAEQLLANATALLHTARQLGMAVVHVQHCAPAGEPLEEGGPGWPIYQPLAPVAGESVVQKRFSSAFAETRLHSLLKVSAVRSVVVTGIQSELCVAATCHAARMLGYHVCLASDAHSTWPDHAHTADAIVAAQNLDLSTAGIELHPTMELIAAMPRLFQS